MVLGFALAALCIVHIHIVAVGAGNTNAMCQGCYKPRVVCPASFGCTPGQPWQAGVSAAPYCNVTYPPLLPPSPPTPAAPRALSAKDDTCPVIPSGDGVYQCPDQHSVSIAAEICYPSGALNVDPASCKEVCQSFSLVANCDAGPGSRPKVTSCSSVAVVPPSGFTASNLQCTSEGVSPVAYYYFAVGPNGPNDLIPFTTLNTIPYSSIFTTNTCTYGVAAMGTNECKGMYTRNYAYVTLGTGTPAPGSRCPRPITV